MAAKTIKTVTTEQTQIPEAEPANEADYVPTPEEEELVEFFRTIGSTANIVKIYKVVDGTRAWCGQAEPSAITEDMILKRWGPGKYSLSALNNGRFVPGGVKTITIYAPDNSTIPAPLAPTDSPGEIALLRENLNRQHEMILKMMEQGNRRSDISEIAAVFEMVQRAAPKPPDMSAMLGPVMEILTKSMELAKDNAGGTDTKLEMFKLIANGVKDVLPQITGALMARKDNGAAPAIVPEPATTPEQVLKQALTVLKDKAVKGKSVETIVDYIADNMEDPANRAMVFSLLNKPFEEIEAFDPELRNEPYHTWFRRLYDELKGVFSGNSETEIDGGPGGGAAKS